MTHTLSMWAKEGNRIIAYDENYNPPSRHSIALLYGPDQDINGALIAATLELLEACKAVVAQAVDEDGCTWCDRATQWGHEDWCPIPQIVAAIAKARGKQ